MTTSDVVEKRKCIRAILSILIPFLSSVLTYVTFWGKQKTNSTAAEWCLFVYFRPSRLLHLCLAWASFLLLFQITRVRESPRGPFRSFCGPRSLPDSGAGFHFQFFATAFSFTKSVSNLSLDSRKGGKSLALP